jgi:glycosyl hydrolase family 1
MPLVGFGPAGEILSAEADEMGWRMRAVASGTLLAGLGSGPIAWAQAPDLTRAGGAYRFNVEWSRVEPAPGTFDAREIDHYRQLAERARQHGLEPVANLFHGSVPAWAASGSVDVGARFRDYAERMAVELGDRIDYWTTLDEPTEQLGDLMRAHHAAYLALKAADTWDADGDGFPSMVGASDGLEPQDRLPPSRFLESGAGGGN